MPLANSYYAGRWAISSVDKSVNHERELCAMSRERRRRTLRRWGAGLRARNAERKGSAPAQNVGPPTLAISG